MKITKGKSGVVSLSTSPSTSQPLLAHRSVSCVFFRGSPFVWLFVDRHARMVPASRLGSRPDRAAHIDMQHGLYWNGKEMRHVTDWARQCGIDPAIKRACVDPLVRTGFQRALR